MPYGPGKFEGEPASTFFVYLNMLDGGGNDDAGNHSFMEGALFPGNDSIDAAYAAGYTEDEIAQARKDLENMAGAIMNETEQGFVSVRIYEDPQVLENDWRETVKYYSDLEAEGAAE